MLVSPIFFERKIIMGGISGIAPETIVIAIVSKAYYHVDWICITRSEIFMNFVNMEENLPEAEPVNLHLGFFRGNLVMFWDHIFFPFSSGIANHTSLACRYFLI